MSWASRAGRKPLEPDPTATASTSSRSSRNRANSLLAPQNEERASVPVLRRFSLDSTASWRSSSGTKKNDESLSFELIVSQSIDDRTTLAKVHKQLVKDPSSIYFLLQDESSKEIFILMFQERSKLIIEFFTKLKPMITKDPTQNAGITKALLEGVVLPLFNDAYQELFVYQEMLDLIIVALENYMMCQNPPGLVSRLFSKFELFPGRKLRERIASDPLGGTVLKRMVESDNRLYSAVLQVDMLKTWIPSLIELAEECNFDHNISNPIEKWKALLSLSNAFPATSSVTTFSSSSGVNRKLLPQHMRRLSKDDKKSGSSSKCTAENQPLNISPYIASLITKTLGHSTLPRTFASARNLVRQLESEKVFEIFKDVLQSYPCGVCHKLLSSTGYKTYGAKHQALPNATVPEYDLLDREMQRFHDIQFQATELQNLGLWRIVLSKQALKDLSDATKSGTFKAVENKLRELASGNWEGRKAMTKKHTNPDFPVPIKKIVYGDNGRIVWQVHVVFDEVVKRASQVILIWRIGNHKDVVKSAPIISRHQKTFGSDFVEACKLRDYDPSSGTTIPQTFGTEVLEQENISPTLSRDESLDLHNTIITGKFYTVSQMLLEGVSVSGSNAEFPFDVAHDEVEIIRQNSSASFILGRSGTGKTTCLVFKLLWRYLASKHIPGVSRPLRQVFITRSEILAAKLNGYIKLLINCQLGHFDRLQSEIIDSEVIRERDEEAETTDFWSLNEEDFPLVCTFDRLLKMVERSIKIGERKFITDEVEPIRPTQTGSGILRMPQEVGFETFKRDYWEKIPSYHKKNIPVDLVFSEIMGIIKGSISSRSGLKVLSRVEYLSKSCRVAPLFTTEAERSQVYDIYELYEKIKAEYRDWDGIDRTQDVFLKMQDNPHVMRQLKEVMEELYVDEIQDQRLLEVELLFSLVKFPRGIHLAGDSAQCISRDSTFRFSDLKGLFFDIFHDAAAAVNDDSLARPKEFRLAQNYRSHQGIIALGAFIIESLWKGFPDLIDKLVPEIGKYSGPKPTFFSGFKAEDILSVQYFGLVDLYNQVADFGADQVILVRDEEVQNSLHSRIGSEVLILTILQSKGMEFEDVVLLNFFSASSYSTNYRALDKLIDGDFDSKRHSVLCAELKNLYVAVTRCRANLHIIEEDAAIAEVIISLWTEKVSTPLIDTVRPGDADAAEKIKALRSGSSGNPEVWKKNGQQLMLKRLYKQAMFCFQKCQHKQLETLAHAHLRRQEAENLASHNSSLGRGTIEELYKKSAELFIEAEHPLEASKSYEVAKLFKEAANMWQQRLRLDKAAPLYEKAGLYSIAADTYHLDGNYSEAAMALRRGQLYEDLIEYLEARQEVLDPKLYQRCSKLLNHLAHQGKLKATHKTRSLQLLGSDLKIELFYRQRGYTSDLLDLFKEKNRIKDAYDYLISIGQFQEAVYFAPPEELENHVPRRQVLAMLQILLITDLRRTKDGKPPPYAMEIHPHARPGMDRLWDALYRRLKYLMRIDATSTPSDLKIEGVRDTVPYLDLIVLEQMDETLKRVHELSALPLDSVNRALEVLRGLIMTSTTSEVPELLRRYMGVYRQPNRSTYNILKTSPLNSCTHSYKRLTREALMDLTKRWCGNMVMKASYAMLDKALILWDKVKPSKQCKNYAFKGSCGYNTVPTTGGNYNICSYNHTRLPLADYASLFEKIQELTKITARLGYVYYMLSPELDEKLKVNFRPRQRRWQEELLAEMTYVSPLRQDPLTIRAAHIHDTAKDPEKYQQYRFLRHNLETLMSRIHARQEWDKRSSFSGLLEQLQRADNFGPRTSYIIRSILDNQTWRSRSYNLQLFRRRPCIEKKYLKNHDIYTMKNFFKQMANITADQLHSFHAVLSFSEKIATYLLLLDGATGETLLVNSWTKLYLPIVWPAYVKQFGLPWSENQQGPSVWLQAEIVECLLELVKCLLQNLKSIVNSEGFQFKSAGDSVRIPQEVLERRCLDTISVCMFNILTATPVPADAYSVWERVKAAFTVSRYGIQLPMAYSMDMFFEGFVKSFKIYAGKESLSLLRNAQTGRFFQYSTTFRMCNIPVIYLQDEVSIMHQEEIESVEPANDSENVLCTDEEKAAAIKISQIWKQYWPLYQKRKAFLNSPLGRATAFIDSLCSSLREDSGRSELLNDLIHTLWRYGPQIYELVESLDSMYLEIYDSYQAFFTTLHESTYTDADLENVEELFEEFQQYEGKIKTIKEQFTPPGMNNWWSGLSDFNTAKTFQFLLKGKGGEAMVILQELLGIRNNKYVDKVNV